MRQCDYTQLYRASSKSSKNQFCKLVLSTQLIEFQLSYISYLSISGFYIEFVFLYERIRVEGIEEKWSARKRQWRNWSLSHE